MKPQVLPWLVCPICQQDLQISNVEGSVGATLLPDQDIQSGALSCTEKHQFPIVAGVPLLSVDAEESGLSAVAGVRSETGRAVSQSFSVEWKEFDFEKTRTWHESVEDRRQLFLTEVDCESSDLDGKLVFDAGCGNGTLSEAISRFGCDVLAMDVSDSVLSAHRYFRSKGADRVHFIRGDIQNLPVRRHSMDVVYSSGVLHHNPDTREAFVTLSKTLKPGGRVYIWVYHDEPGVKFWLQLRLRALLRPFPMSLKNVFVYVWSLQSMARQHLRTLLKLNDGKDRLTWKERIIDLRDIYTPRYRWMHTQDEVKGWYQQVGLTKIKTTEVRDWGFGVVGVSTATVDETVSGGHGQPTPD